MASRLFLMGRGITRELTHEQFCNMHTVCIAIDQGLNFGAERRIDAAQWEQRRRRPRRPSASSNLWRASSSLSADLLEVSAEELVAKANVTRGALYHHYAGKEGLFEAVVDTIMGEIHRDLIAV